MTDTREEFEKWYTQAILPIHDLSLPAKYTKEALEWAWEAALNTRTPSPANSEVVQAFEDAYSWVDIRDVGAEFEGAWEKYGDTIKAALSALPQVRQMTVEEVAEVLRCSFKDMAYGDYESAARALAKLGAVKITDH